VLVRWCISPSAAPSAAGTLSSTPIRFACTSSRKRSRISRTVRYGRGACPPHAARTGKSIDGVEEGVVSLLQDYHWPGNVRELENAIERAVVFASGSTITRDAVKVNASVPIPTTGVPSLKLRQNVEWIERETIARALEVSTDKQQAARLMGISPRALSYYLAKYRLMEDDQMRRRLQARQ
jgi:DNA-binding NtrC family response regulator